jgi:hypothetical protein
MNHEITETIWYNFGTLKTSLSCNGITIAKGQSAAISVDVWSDKQILIHINSGRKNICLPYQTGYQSWI